MTWRADFQEGSFRNVPFLIDASEFKGGRRTVLHEFPGRDKPYVEDLGRSAREYKIACYVIGEQYPHARDALIRALEQAGPGTLVHPYFGTRRVAVLGTFTVRESSQQGGMAAFDVTFVESHDEPAPTASADSATAVISASRQVKSTSLNEFGTRFSVSGMPSFVSQAALDQMQALTRLIDDLLTALPRVPGNVTKALQELDLFSAAVSSRLKAPLDLGESMQAILDQVLTIIERPVDAINAYRQLSFFGRAASTIAPTTMARRQQGQNQKAIHDLVRRQAIASMAELATQVNWENAMDAEAMAGELSARLDEEADLAASAGADAVYLALQSLRGLVLRHLIAHALSLPRIVEYTSATTRPAIVLAYEIYGDAGRASEIIARNAIRHPGFVPANRPLRILANA